MRSEARARQQRRNARPPAAALIALAATACGSPQSFIVLQIQAAATPITGVMRLVVAVGRGATPDKTLTYTTNDVTIDQSLTNTLSVSFSGGETGDVTFDVTALDAAGCGIGVGETVATIRKGAVNEAPVALAVEHDCAVDGGAVGPGSIAGVDGGATDGSAAAAAVDPFPGCDPVQPMCGGNGQTCQIDCTASRNECVNGGSGGPGSVSGGNDECAPGTQRFDYAALGCDVGVCLRFCNSDADCAAVADGGAGPGSACRDPVVCGQTATAYRTCSFSCDPCAYASGGGGGCPGGLACVASGDGDQVDCSCPASTRTGHAGDACAGGADCAPGFLCDDADDGQRCRAICRCDASAGACTAALGDCPGGTACTPAGHNTIYGVCL